MKKIVFAIVLVFSVLLFSKNSETDKLKIEKEIKKLKLKLYEVEKEKKTILANIKKLDLLILISRKEIQKTRREYLAYKKKSKKLEDEIKRLSDLKRKKEDELKKVFKIHYIEGEMSFIKFYFAGKNINSLIEAGPYLEIVEKKLYEGFKEYKNILNDLREKKRALNQALKLKEEKLSQLRKEWTIYVNRKNQKKALLNKIIRKRKELFKMLKEKKEQLNRLKNLIEEEESVKKVFPENFRNFSSYKRKLRWPIRGRVVESYGIKWHPKYRIKLKSTGIEIKPRRGEEKVRAVMDGIVIYADYFSGYGNTVILEHLGGYYTIYAHLDDYFVDVGSAVKEGEVIGVVGETGTFGEKTLFFGIRKGKKAQNPLSWLRRR